MNDKNSPIFCFDKHRVTSFLNHEKQYYSKLKGALGYIFGKMEELGHSQKLESLENINLSKINEKEGKNYNWSVVQYKNIKFLIRRYGNHFTVFVNKHNPEKNFNKNEISAFTFNYDRDSMDLSDNQIDRLSDELYDNPFKFFNQYLKPMIEVIQDRGTYWFWNSACLPREKHIEIEVAFEGKESIFSYDKLFYCYEEIDSFHTCLFAENDMLQKLEEVKERIGEQFDSQNKIHSVSTKVKDGYFHGVGITLIKENGETSFNDVYSLTQFYYDNVFIPAPLEQNDFTIDIVNKSRYINAIVENKLTQSFILPKLKEKGFDNLIKYGKNFDLISIPTDEKETKHIIFEICEIERYDRLVKIYFHSLV